PGGTGHLPARPALVLRERARARRAAARAGLAGCPARRGAAAVTSPAEGACIGGGHMARRLVQGLLAEGRDPARIVVADPDADTRRALSAGLQVQATAHNTEAAAAAPVWVLAVKPQVARSVCEALAGVASSTRPLVVSIMAG